MSVMTEMMKDELIINVQYLNKGTFILKAINHTLRQQMLQIIHLQKRITVTELYIKLRMEQSVASQHLAILRRAGFVTTRREGKFVFYSINHEKLNHVQHLIQGIVRA